MWWGGHTFHCWEEAGALWQPFPLWDVAGLGWLQLCGGQRRSPFELTVLLEACHKSVLDPRCGPGVQVQVTSKNTLSSACRSGVCRGGGVLPPSIPRSRTFPWTCFLTQTKIGGGPVGKERTFCAPLRAREESASAGTARVRGGRRSRAGCGRAGGGAPVLLPRVYRSHRGPCRVHSVPFPPLNWDWTSPARRASGTAPTPSGGRRERQGRRKARGVEGRKFQKGLFNRKYWRWGVVWVCFLWLFWWGVLLFFISLCAFSFYVEKKKQTKNFQGNQHP